MPNWQSADVAATIAKVIIVTPTSATIQLHDWTSGTTGPVLATFATAGEAIAWMRENEVADHSNGMDGGYTVTILWNGNKNLPWCEQGRD